MEAKRWNKENISELLQKSDKAVLRGLVVIYSLQTESEQECQETVFNNGVGFSGVDANFLSSLAQQFIKRGTLSEKQMVLLRKKMLRYAGQLAKVANGKIQVAV